MECVHYRNNILNTEIIPLKQMDKIKKIIITKIEYHKDISKQMLEIDLNKEKLNFNGNSYQCFVSEKTPQGEFFVAEKWEFPYWKKNGLIYAPNANNPIGENLIILANKTTLEKIPQSIHGIPKSPFGKKRMGCIRVNDYDLKNIFNNLDLGASVYIKK